MKLVNSFDVGQADATVITSGNSGDASNDAVTSTGSPTFDSTHAHSGTQAMTVPTAAQALARWDITASTHVWGRVYAWFDSVTGGGFRCVQGDTNVGSNVFRLSKKTTNGVLTMNVNGSGTASGTVAIAAGQWVRIEYELQITGGNAIFTAKLFNSPESTTPDDTVTTTVAVADTGITAVRWGAGSSTGTGVWFDDAELNDTGYPGPLVVGGSTVNLDLGAISSPAAANGLDLTLTRALALGALPGGSPSGPDLVLTRGLHLGHVASAAAPHGLDLGRTIGLHVGAIPSPAVLHGPTITDVIPLLLGHIASPAAAHGLDLKRTRRLTLGHAASAAHLNGLDVATSVLHGRYIVLVELYDTRVMVSVADPALLVQLAQPDLRVSL